MRPLIRLSLGRLVYQNPFANVFDDDVTFPDGTSGRYLRVQPTGDGPGVVLLPLHHDRIGLVRTFRYAVGGWQGAAARVWPRRRSSEDGEGRVA